MHEGSDAKTMGPSLPKAGSWVTALHPSSPGASEWLCPQDFPEESSGLRVWHKMSPLTPSGNYGQVLSSGKEADESRVPRPSQVVCMGLFLELPRTVWNLTETPQLISPWGPPGTGRWEKAVWARCCNALHVGKDLTGQGVHAVSGCFFKETSLSHLPWGHGCHRTSVCAPRSHQVKSIVHREPAPQ